MHYVASKRWDIFNPTVSQRVNTSFIVIKNFPSKVEYDKNYIEYTVHLVLRLILNNLVNRNRSKYNLFGYN